jgi:hypothetical protein
MEIFRALVVAAFLCSDLFSGIGINLENIRPEMLLLRAKEDETLVELEPTVTAILAAPAKGVWQIVCFSLDELAHGLCFIFNNLMCYQHLINLGL